MTNQPKEEWEQLRVMLVEIYDCTRAWDNDDGKMAEANVKTPEDILAGYLEDARKEERERIMKMIKTKTLQNKYSDIDTTFEIVQDIKSLT